MEYQFTPGVIRRQSVPRPPIHRDRFVFSVFLGALAGAVAGFSLAAWVLT